MIFSFKNGVLFEIKCRKIFITNSFIVERERERERDTELIEILGF
jgi:hypothetical protein